MKKIIYICSLPLTEKLSKDYHIGHLYANKFDVEYWDITNIYFQNLKLPDATRMAYIKKIYSYDDFKNRLIRENLENTIFVLLISFEAKTVGLFKILTKYEARMCFFHNAGWAPPNENLFRRLLMKPRLFMNITEVHKSFLNKFALLLKRFKLIKEYDIVFAAGNIAADSCKNILKVVKINYFDYDEYLLAKNNDGILVKGKYCVFLDDYLPYHPDIKIANAKPIDPVKYYKVLNRFFDMIEEKYQVKVVIGAHPKSDYKSNVFCNREVFKYKTNELVKNCEFTIVTASSAVSYPVLYKKQILFFSTDEIKRKYSCWLYSSVPILRANSLNCSFFNIDSVRDKEEITIRDIDLEKYNTYKYNFLTSEDTENKLSKDIVLDYLRNQE